MYPERSLAVFENHVISLVSFQLLLVFLAWAGDFIKDKY